MPHVGLSGGLWLVGAAPLLVLSAVGLFGHAPGEWGRAALLAYAAVLLGCLGGMAIPGFAEVPWLGRLVAATAVGTGFVALSVGGAAGHWVIAAGHAAFALVCLARPEVALPWPLAALAAAAAVLAAVRTVP